MILRNKAVANDRAERESFGATDTVRLSGQATVTEDGQAHVLHPGDAACWPAGVPTAHHVSNQSSRPACV